MVQIPSARTHSSDYQEFQPLGQLADLRLLAHWQGHRSLDCCGTNLGRQGKQWAGLGFCANGHYASNLLRYQADPGKGPSQSQTSLLHKYQSFQLPSVKIPLTYIRCLILGDAGKVKTRAYRKYLTELAKGHGEYFVVLRAKYLG